MRYLGRDEWGAGPLTAGAAAPHAQFVGLVIHHTVVAYSGDPVAYMRRLQKARPDLSNDVPYSFIVMPGDSPDDCVVGEGRGFGRTGAHTVGYNSTAYGIAFAGDFTATAPTPGMLEGVRWIGSQLHDPINAMHTLGHRDTYGTACPGACAYPLLNQLQPPFEPLEDDDVALSDEDVQRIAEAVWAKLIPTRRGAYPALNVLGWTKDEITEPDLLLARIDSSDDDEKPTFVGEGASAKAIADELSARLRD